MPTRRQERERRFQFYGWVLFVVCSFFFIADGVTTMSLLGIIGSALFLLGCVVFLIPFIWKRG